MKKLSKTNWDQLNQISDKDIDYSDIPSTNSDFWNDAEVFVPHKKVEVSLQVDEDIALWLNKLKDNKIAINQMLRSYYTTLNKVL